MTNALTNTAASTSARYRPQSVWAALAQIASAGVAVILIAAAVMMNLGKTSDPGTLMKWAGDAGNAVLEQTGWVFTMYFTAVLGFFISLVVERNPEGTQRTRRVLARTAIIIAATTLPILLIIIAYCFQNNGKAGVLVVFIPATALIVFLATFVGIYNGYDDAELLAQAKETKVWIKNRLTMLGDAPNVPSWASRYLEWAEHPPVVFRGPPVLTRRLLKLMGRILKSIFSPPAWVVAPTYALVATGALALGTVVLTRTSASDVIVLILATLAATGAMLFVSTYTVYFFKISSSNSEKLLILLAPIALGLFYSGAAVIEFSSDARAAIVTAIIPILTLALSFFPNWRWSIQGSATKHARNTLNKALATAEEEICHIESTLGDNQASGVACGHTPM